MQLDLSEDQSLLRGAVDQLLKKYQSVPLDQPTYCFYSAALQQELAESGFLSVCAEDGFGPLEAALIIEAVAQSPWSAEVAASALLAPALGISSSAPLALCQGVGQPTRFLAQASHALVRNGSELLLAALQPGDVAPVESVVAYPLGILKALPGQYRALDHDLSDKAHRLWSLGLAAEAAGLMRAAFNLTVAYVKERRQFGRPLGDLQAIQHRLAANEQVVSATHILAMRAADTLTPGDIATATLYAQHYMRRVMYDCHQFTGAMGLTLEYPLHLWTYRLKFIQGELGGRAAHAQDVAASVFA